MTPDWLKSDIIATRLIAMGWHSSEAYEKSERCAIVAEGCGIPIEDAAIATIGFYPYSADVAEAKAKRGEAR